MTDVHVVLDTERVEAVAAIVQASSPPPEDESGDLSFSWNGSRDELANAYLAIVAICHQTSPLGERRLEGTVSGAIRVGWDYLKARFLIAADRDRWWTQPEYWTVVSPTELSAVYKDGTLGLTLNRVSERAYLLNDLGRMLRSKRVSGATDAFQSVGCRLGGDGGFLAFLASAEAYSDPIRKKGLFFCSIAMKECAWRPNDPDTLLSPVDYHELRGHLRIGTVRVVDSDLRERIERTVALSEREDTAIRAAVQRANDEMALKSGVTSSVLHYLLWNIFRNCCPRPSEATHCHACNDCKLPPQYKAMPTYAGRCIFAGVCESAGRPAKVVEPPYAGHFY